MKHESKKVAGIFARYLTVILLGLGNLKLFYDVLTPLTLKVLETVLSITQKTPIIVEDIFIGMQHFTIAIVPACVAGAAFYLLFILVFSTANIKPKKRALFLLIALATLFFLNIVRIFFLIAIINHPWFGTVHWVLWNFASTIFVIAIWIFLTKYYKIRSIPVYSDFKYIAGLIKKSK